MFCTSCGHQNSDEARFCAACGRPSATLPATTVSTGPPSATGEAATPKPEILGNIILAIPIIAGVVAFVAWLTTSNSLTLTGISVLTILTTAILICVEASTLGMGSPSDLNAKGRRRDGPAAWLLGSLLLWLLVYPYYLRRRSSYGVANRQGISVLSLLVFFGGLLCGPLVSRPGFTDEDISTVKARIRAEYEKRPGVTVSDMKMIKDSDKHLTGWVKFTDDGGQRSVDCSATMGDGRQYIWRCQ